MQLFSASLNKMILDLSSWDFFCPLSTMHRVNFHSLIYLSEQAATKVLGNLTCISITPEWLARDKKLTHDAETPLLFMPPLSSILFFFSFSFLSSFPLPLPKTKYKSTSKCSFHFKRFWTISQVASNLSEVFLFWSFKKRRFFFLLLMKSWQRDFRRKLFSLPLRAF